MKTIGIFGIGAIGSVLAKYLTKNTINEYLFFNRTNYESISIEYQQEVTKIPITISTNLDNGLDWLIVCLKEHQVKGAKEEIKRLLSERTKLAIFQNGIDLSKPYINLINGNQILETAIDCSVERINNSNYRQLKEPIITLLNSTLANEFISLFGTDEIVFNLTEEFKKDQWVKLIESSSIGSIQSYTEKPCSIFDDSKYLSDFTLLVEEGIRVAQSEKIELDSNIQEKLSKKLMNYPKTKGSSMLTDKLSGNVLELDAKIGAIVKISRNNNIEVPISERYYKSLLNYNKEKTQSIKK